MVHRGYMRISEKGPTVSTHGFDEETVKTLSSWTRRGF